MQNIGIFEVPTGACEPSDPSRKLFRTPHEPDIQDLWVPNWLEDSNLRWLIRHGATLEDAYKKAYGGTFGGGGIYDIIPPITLRPCILDALKTPGFDPTTQEMVSIPGNFTCQQFFQCYIQYVQGNRESPPLKPGRMKIAENLFAPSPSEEQCIRQRFVNLNDIEAAYAACDCSDIFPNFSNAKQLMEKAIISKPEKNLYYLIKMLYFFGEEPVTPPAIPVHHHAPARDDDKDKDKEFKGAMWIAVAAVAAVVLLR